MRGEVKNWLIDRRVDIAFALVIAVVIYAALYMFMVAYPQQQVQLCMRAFEYTRDQCSFMVRNRIAP